MHGKIDTRLLMASNDLILPELDMRNALHCWRALHLSSLSQVRTGDLNFSQRHADAYPPVRCTHSYVHLPNTNFYI